VIVSRRKTSKPGWVAFTPTGATVHAVHVVQEAGLRPRVCWTDSHAWSDPVRALQEGQRNHSLKRHQKVLVLQRNQYHLQTMEAPEVPRADWCNAVRWHLKEQVDFDVATASVDVLEIPANTRQRRPTSLWAIAAARAVLAPLMEAGEDAGLDWQAIDIPETALRNICALAAIPGQGQALLHIGELHSTLVVTCDGDLLMARHLDLTLDHMAEPDESIRRQALDRAAIELQRTLDSVERLFNHISLQGLLVAPGLAAAPLIAHAGELVYVPMAALDLATILDLSALPGPPDPESLCPYLPAIGAALRMN
jgi:MSHA biogenesis protein MshI